jgi:hypothetical protein
VITLSLTRRASRLVAALCAGLVAAACSSFTTTPDGSATLAVTAVSPSSVTTGGGTTITVTGTNFGSDAKVFIDSVALTGIAVTGTTSITGVTPSHAAGAANLSVTSGGKTVPFTGAFAYVAPSGSNAPPVISLIRTIGARANQPSTFADLNDQIAVIATVTDKETPVSQLAYAWTASVGTISGTGATVTWTAPATLTTSPTTVTLQLSVTETFTENGITHRQTTTSAVAIFAHDSNKELLDMGEDFLRLFSQQVAPALVLHNFSQTCDGGNGYNDEYSDTVHNQVTFTQLPTWVITRLPPVTLNFGGTCFFGDPPAGTDKSKHADACANLHAHWDARHDRDPSDPFYGTTDHTNGIDQVTGVLENNQWRLCHSSFVGDPGSATEAAHQIMLDARYRIIKRQ